MEKWLPAEGLWLDGGFIRQADSANTHGGKMEHEGFRIDETRFAPCWE